MVDLRPESVVVDEDDGGLTDGLPVLRGQEVALHTQHKCQTQKAWRRRVFQDKNHLFLPIISF